MSTVQDVDYVLGSNVPIWFAAKDYFPDPKAPDWTDFSLATINVAYTYAEFRAPDSTETTKVALTRQSQTIDGASVAGVQVSADNAVATLTEAGTWSVRIVADLFGDTKPCKSRWYDFEVVE